MECAGQPVIDTDPAGDQRGGEERRGVGEIGFDRDLLGPRNARLDQPFADGGTFDADAAAAQSLDRHVDVRKARQVLAGVDQVQADVEAGGGEQETGDELARRGGVDLDASAADSPVAADREGESPRAFVVDVDAEVAQRADQRAHRTMQRRLVRREVHVVRREARQRGDEAHDGAGLTAVDRGAAAELRGGDDEVGLE